jgi:hypothetical protein
VLEPSSGKEDLSRCAHISCPMRSGLLWLCPYRRLKEDNKEEKSWWMYPHIGVNHIYPVLWLLCAYACYEIVVIYA